jgi:hypothetical protein
VLICTGSSRSPMMRAWASSTMPLISAAPASTEAIWRTNSRSRADERPRIGASALAMSVATSVRMPSSSITAMATPLSAAGVKATRWSQKVLTASAKSTADTSNKSPPGDLRTA